MAGKGKWIAGAIQNKGGLHESLGVAQEKKIPAKKVEAAAAGKYGAKAERQAHLAETLKGLRKGK